MQTLDQMRAEYAWKCAEEGKSLSDYANLAKGAPALIMGNGLMQAMAYYQSKSDSGRKLTQHVANWLFLQKTGNAAAGSFQAMMKALHTCEAAQYMRATEESLEILRWIRQLADAVTLK